MTQEHESAGIIPFSGTEPIEYLLLHYPQGHWGFPKGHLEARDESHWNTAVRELKEETDLDVHKLVENFKENVEYSYRRNDEQHHKIVYFFAAEVEGKPVSLSVEHQDFLWLPENETLDQITYDEERELFRTFLEQCDPSSP